MGMGPGRTATRRQDQSGSEYASGGGGRVKDYLNGSHKGNIAATSIDVRMEGARFFSVFEFAREGCSRAVHVPLIPKAAMSGTPASSRGDVHLGTTLHLPYIFAGALAEAMHCHLPSGILVQVSTQRS